MGPLVGWGESPNGAIQLNERPNSTSSVWRLSCRRLTHYGCRTARTTNLGLHFTQLAGTLRLQTAGRLTRCQMRVPMAKFTALLLAAAVLALSITLLVLAVF
jgi:hypothetical protein